MFSIIPLCLDTWVYCFFIDVFLYSAIYLFVSLFVSVYISVYS